MRLPKGIKENWGLKKYNSFKIDGRARYFAEISSKDRLIRTLRWAKDNSFPVFILGNGSNVLFAGRRYEGLILKINNNRICKINRGTITVGAGMMLSELLLKFAARGWQGMEWCSGIPATVGGAVCGNAGSFGYEFGDLVKKVKVVDPETLAVKTRQQKTCGFSYRESIFKKNKEIIWEVELFTKKGSRRKITEQMNEYWRYKIGRGTFKYPSAGSVFKNIFARDVPQRYRQNATIKKGKISAGWFIERCGLKGKKRGGAMVSLNHGNMIVNVGGAKADDVLFLIRKCRKAVKEKFKIDLQEEIIIMNGHKS